MRRQGWESSKDTENLRQQIDAYVTAIVEGSIPQIAFYGYQQYVLHGSRREFEEAYFEVRKQLAALALYLQYHTLSDKSEDSGTITKNMVSEKAGTSSTEKVKAYFNELLWSVAHEFSWCLAAHLPFNETGFIGEPAKHIDLFAAETAQTLSEIITLHSDKIHPFIQTYLRSQIDDRVLTPFLEKNWGWETSRNNWCAVCAGSIGMTALLLEHGERKKQILAKVDQALAYYLQCFGEDGATEEGIGYWVYGFGYYTYYTEMRKELDTEYHIPEQVCDKLKKIAEFPQLLQMTEDSFVPFSDVSARTQMPTGLLSYLQQEYGVEVPACTKITSFDFDHCYRFAHISRNLWWTNIERFHSSVVDIARYLPNKQWLLQRKGPYFFAVKGGNNKEEHNHNDVGSFIFAIRGELLLADLGAGPYTADYFGEKRYQYPHTRSRYHNVPILQELEQKLTSKECKVEQVMVEDTSVSITMELSMMYLLPALQAFRRTITSDVINHRIVLEDYFVAENNISIEEGFISIAKPMLIEEGVLQLKGKKGLLTLSYDSSILNYVLEELKLRNHRNETEMVYRIGLRAKEETKEFKLLLEFSYKDESMVRVS